MNAATQGDPSPIQQTEGSGQVTVLIVDDSLVDRRIAGSFVDKIDGLKAVYASDGSEALALIEKQEPAVVVTDMQMPGMDGLALVETIRELFPRIPVVLMTAHGSEEVAMKALRAGASNYVPKKNLATDLIPTLNKVLSVIAVDRGRRRILNSLEFRNARLQVENDPELLAPLIELLQEDLSEMDLCDETERMRVGVALQEAFANALFHGNLEVSSDLRQDDEREFYNLANERRTKDPFRARSIHIEARFDREEAVYTIRDEGPGFDTASLDRPIDPEDLMRIGGRGMLLIRTFMDRVSHNPSGNQITLVKRCKAPKK